MIQQESEHINPQNFESSIRQFTFQQRYFKWEEYIKQLKAADSHYYQASLEKVVEYYPFNFTFWNDLLDTTLTVSKDKKNTFKIYQLALAKNPRCITLWKKYLSWIHKELIKADPNYLKNQLENASKIIGNHFKASFIFEYYLEIESNPQKKYNMLKKAIVSPLQDIDRIKELYLNLVDSPEFQPCTGSVAQAEGLTLSQLNQGKVETNRILQEELKHRIAKLYQPTRQHVSERQTFENKIKNDEYIPYSDSIDNWRKYIAFIKNSGNNQFLPSIYERALINHCDNEALWQEYFLLLENEGNHQRALYLFRSHSTFFRNMSKQLIYYWLEIQERDNPNNSRELYLELESSTYDLEIFMRHIQMELRAKDFPNAKSIYEAILTIFTANLQIVVQIVIEYADFSVRYFRDIAFAKKLLQNYFSSYPFNECLFINLLEFYEKNIECKQGTKQSKQILDEYVEYLLLGLKKAYRCYELDAYKRIRKIANYHMRRYIMSIYLIKGAERKIKQQQIILRNQGDLDFGKRTSDQKNGDQEMSGRKATNNRI